MTARLQGARHCQRSPVVTDYRAVMDLVLKGWSVSQNRTTVGCSHTTVQKAREALEASGITTEAQLAGLSSESLAGLWQRQARRTGEQSSCIGSCQPGSKRCSRGAREPSPLQPRCSAAVFELVATAEPAERRRLKPAAVRLRLDQLEPIEPAGKRFQRLGSS